MPRSDGGALPAFSLRASAVCTKEPQEQKQQQKEIQVKEEVPPQEKGWPLKQLLSTQVPPSHNVIKVSDYEDDEKYAVQCCFNDDNLDKEKGGDGNVCMYV